MFRRVRGEDVTLDHRPSRLLSRIQVSTQLLINLLSNERRASVSLHCSSGGSKGRRVQPCTIPFLIFFFLMHMLRTPSIHHVALASPLGHMHGRSSDKSQIERFEKHPQTSTSCLCCKRGTTLFSAANLRRDPPACGRRLCSLRKGGGSKKNE